MNNAWKGHADAATVDIMAALSTQGAAALDHLRDAALNIDEAIAVLESEADPEA